MALTPLDSFARLKALQHTSDLRIPPQPRTALEHIADDADGISHVECGDSIANRLGGQERRNQFGEYIAISRWCPEPDPAEINAAALRLLWPDAPDLVADPEQWLFLDTETTGLAGGTGTYAFLVGLAWWDAGGIQVEQFFMRELDDEWPVLSALADRLEQRPVLVTFNGKSFDWPLLETRYRMTRTITPPQPRGHLDFLHPSRAIWGLRLRSVRLAELERQVLGWDRGEDVVSNLIPQIYLEFLRGGPPELLLPVLRHNQLDLRGLATLSCRLLSLVADPESRAQNALDVYRMSRIYERRGELKRARSLYECSLTSCLPAETDRAARISVARLAKHDGDYMLALDHWQKAVGISREGLHAYEQLAIYYEHRARQPQRALEITRQAINELRQAHRLGTIATLNYRQWKGRFEHRLARLERKAAFSLSGELSFRSVRY
jgi:uncharacterized protein YprB with RNaseH-like and TPR domain